MVFGSTCQIGDAAITPRPHAAAGAVKAAADAWSLAGARAQDEAGLSSLRDWEKRQLGLGRPYLRKVRNMGTLLGHGAPFAPGDPANRFGLPTEPV